MNEWQQLHAIFQLLAPRIDGPLSTVQQQIQQIADTDTKVEAKAHITNILGLYNLWSQVIDHKANGRDISPAPFQLKTMMEWLKDYLTLPSEGFSDVTLYAHRASLQEAFILLHSVASSQGSQVKVHIRPTDDICTIQINFIHKNPMPNSLDSYIRILQLNPANRQSSAELMIAKLLLDLSGSNINLNWNPKTVQATLGVEIKTNTAKSAAEQANAKPQTVKLPIGEKESSDFTGSRKSETLLHALKMLDKERKHKPLHDIPSPVPDGPTQPLTVPSEIESQDATKAQKKVTVADRQSSTVSMEQPETNLSSTPKSPSVSAAEQQKPTASPKVQKGEVRS